VLEQQLAERFRAAVDDEPPFELDPDELVDRLLRSRRRRLGLATALGVVVVATIAVGGAAVSGAAGGAPVGGAAAGQPTTPAAPATATTPAEVTVAAAVPAGSVDVVAEQREQKSVRSVSDFLVDAEPTDRGTLEIRRDDDVLFQADLAMLDAYVFRPVEPLLLKPGQRVLVAVTCARTLSRTGACHADVTFPVLVVAR
jgi:hypothetical protein